ncbi:LPS assembly lipoprotein LptE [Rhizosphaericola mali]|uniref:LptE family protein n=1 Tax=Rhizosphaericola mali TaxID=2545455 RepID=A0A5P2G7S2_9BACT|nr:LPS assembly lipoprotein LptE [Rhizosphaericola mali]QES90748.1 hypothetical protein E0W69_019510 [Rhizosphaericola mali]
MYLSKYLKIGVLLIILCSLISCGVYSFKNTIIPDNVKTVHINLFTNKARYINPQVGPKITDALVQQINNQTKLTLTDDNNADYQISGYISGYDVTTSGIGSTTGTQTASMNRLVVTFHLIWVDATKNNKKQEFNVTQNFDFSSNLSLQEAEVSLMSDIVKNVSESIFNDIFGNW